MVRPWMRVAPARIIPQPLTQSLLGIGPEGVGPGQDDGETPQGGGGGRLRPVLGALRRRPRLVKPLGAGGGAQEARAVK